MRHVPTVSRAPREQEQFLKNQLKLENVEKALVKYESILSSTGYPVEPPLGGYTWVADIDAAA